MRHSVAEAVWLGAYVCCCLRRAPKLPGAHMLECKQGATLTLRSAIAGAVFSGSRVVGFSPCYHCAAFNLLRRSSRFLRWLLFGGACLYCWFESVSVCQDCVAFDETFFRWESDDGSKFNDFDPNTSSRLETALATGLPRFEISERNWLFDLVAMTQTNIRVRRSPPPRLSAIPVIILFDRRYQSGPLSELLLQFHPNFLFLVL